MTRRIDQPPRSVRAERAQVADDAPPLVPKEDPLPTGEYEDRPSCSAYAMVSPLVSLRAAMLQADD